MREPSRKISSAKLKYDEIWFEESLELINSPISAGQVSADMSQVLRALEIERKKGHNISATHVLIHLVGKILKSNPRFHQLIIGHRRYNVDKVSIGLSVSGDNVVTPVLVIDEPDTKSPQIIAGEISKRLPQLHEADKAGRQMMNKWGFTLPFKFLRMWLMKIMINHTMFRLEKSGTFQITTVALDWGLTTSFLASGVLTAGQIKQSVVALKDSPEVRPMMTLTLSTKHNVWDGNLAARFLATLKADLEKYSP